MSMATGASQHSHYAINKASVNHSSSMVSSQGGPNRGWASEGKTDLPMGSRGQPNWGPSNVNLNPSANPSAWPVLGHEAPGMGSRPGGMGGPGGVAPIQGTSGNGGLVGDCAWGNPDTPDQHQSPTSLSFGIEPPNSKTDGLNTKVEPMSPVNSWGRTMSQSPTEQASGDGTSQWGEPKNSESKESGWDSGGISGWGQSGNDTRWGQWSKQPSTEGTGWDADGPTQESMNTWGANAPGSEGSKDGSEGRSEGRPRSSSMEAPLLPRQDLDPRVLCNSGWGQTPVRQHTVWEMDENLASKDGGGTDTWSNTPSTGSSPPQTGCANPNVNAPPRMESANKNEGLSRANTRWEKPASPTGWGEPPANKKMSNGSWGEPDGPNPNDSSGGSWGSDEKSPSWNDNSKSACGDGPNPSSGWGSWGEPSDGKMNSSPTSSWDGDGGSWKEPQKNWGKAPPAGGGNWRDSQRSNDWTGKPQESSGVVNMGSWGGPNSVKQSGSGWASTARHESGEEATGWEEPSPSSIRRKMEIDDGTSTWGDPSSYRTSVNMWDRNTPSSQGSHGTGNGGNNVSNHPGPNNNNHQQAHYNKGQNHSDGSNNANQIAPPHNRMPMINPGWGDLPHVQSKSDCPTWVEPDSSSTTVDNGTAAWGKSPKVNKVWGENGHESTGSYSRGTGSSKPAPKSMQDGWGSGGDEMGVGSSSQWDSEDGDMWTSPTSQDSTSSSWNQSKKGMQKVKISNKQDEVWIMNRLIKQLTDMGFPRDPAEEALRSNNMNLDQAMSALLEKKSDGEKRGMRTLMCRPPNLSKDSLDRAPFMDKDGGLSDDAPASPFIHSPGLKLTNGSLPSHGVGGVSPGHNMQNLNSRQMNGMFGSNGAAQSRAPPPQPLSSAHHSSLRAQVPQFLSPQVQAQLLQFAAKNIGLNPALLTSPINPQHMTLLYQLQQLQMAYQRLQIQQQMMQAQRNVSGPIRQQEQQVARTISNMQQQIQQHQRQLAQALLIKQQQQQASSTHSYPNLGKPNLDNFPGNTHTSPGLSISDLHTKEQHNTSGSFGSYPLSGLNGSVGVGCIDSLKDAPPQPQSRLSQWTHTSTMEPISTSTSSSTPSSTHSANVKPVMDSFSPYNLISNSQSPSSPLGAPESWTPGKNSDKMANGTNINWPPEFCPGVPWKGLQNIDPESDPNVTPGSVSGGPTINTNIQDVNRYLLRDRNGGKLMDLKSTWSAAPAPHAQSSLSSEMWKVPVGGRSSTGMPRPPPGLTNNKHNNNWTPGVLSHSWSREYSSEGPGWSSEGSSRTSSWLVLRNLTPQIDGSTLRTLCMQHGPLITFHLSLAQGNALVRYSSKEEAAKAQKSLHMCVLGNTTILAEFAGEEEVTRFFSQAQSYPPSSGSTHPSLGQWGTAGAKGSGNPSGGGTNGAGPEMLWGGVQQPYSSLWGPINVNGEETRVMGSPVPINTLLPGDLLSGENM